MKRKIILPLLLLAFALTACGIGEELYSVAVIAAQDETKVDAEPAIAQETEPEAELETEQETEPETELETKQESEPETELETEPEAELEKESALLPENGSYTSKEEVALYLHQYGRLPSNFITKREAETLGWPGGDLEPYAPGKCIGGNRFGNYEGRLPEKEGRYYTECDIDTLGEHSRGAKRLVFSNDGLIYYTEDHYETFELLYGEE